MHVEAAHPLLFWFAGHGHTEKTSYGAEIGYIVPVDAPPPARDKEGFLQKALSLQRMEEYARQINAKHALFLFDSCFSGQMFAMSRAIPEQIGYKTSLPVRQFITSGTAEETVPDRSVFREQFVAALAGEGDTNRDGYVTGAELGEFLQSTVMHYTRQAQHPQYGRIVDPRLDKGDFVFQVIRGQEVATEPLAPPPPPALPAAPADPKRPVTISSKYREPSTIPWLASERSASCRSSWTRANSASRSKKRLSRRKKPPSTNRGRC